MTKETLNRISIGGLFLYFLGRVLSNHVHELSGYIVSGLGLVLLFINIIYKVFHYNEYKKEVWFYVAILVFFVLLYLILKISVNGL